jgi:AAA15 family ATPase/GTPase
MSLIKEIRLEQFSAFEELTLNNLGKINVIIGENDTGKTHLLKTFYAITRSIEEFHRKEKSPAMIEEIQQRKEEKDSVASVFSPLLVEKLKWIFLPTPFNIGSLVHQVKKAGKSSISLLFDSKNNSNTSVNFEFNQTNKDKIPVIHSNNLDGLKDLKAVFIPAKEILTLFDAIQETREGIELGAFDDTYYDLVRDFRLDAGRTRTSKVFTHLDSILGSNSINYKSGKLTFSKAGSQLSIHQAAEGIKKLLLVKQVLLNKRMVTQKQGVVFIDEPEANLHPQAVLQFAEFLSALADEGIQIFLATHSYFLIKRLEQLAIEKDADYKLIDLRRGADDKIKATTTDLKDYLSDNPIIQQSQKLYQYDVDRLLGKSE